MKTAVTALLITITAAANTAAANDTDTECSLFGVYRIHYQGEYLELAKQAAAAPASKTFEGLYSCAGTTVLYPAQQPVVCDLAGNTGHAHQGKYIECTPSSVLQ